MKMRELMIVVNSQISRTVGYLKPDVIYLFTYFMVLRIKLRLGLIVKHSACQDRRVELS